MVLGDMLLKAAREARREVLLIAPFIKAYVLQKVLDEMPLETPITVVSRWIPMEIAQGVCDLEIFNVLVDRANSKLLVHPLLHAKLFRFDDVTLVGSANLTGKALGWKTPPNLEILISPTEAADVLAEFESRLLSTAILVDQEYYDTTARNVLEIKTNMSSAVSFDNREAPSVPTVWLPKCRAPEKLWDVYFDSTNARRRIVENAFLAACDDLAALEITPGLSQSHFKNYLTAVLLGMPIVQLVDAAAQSGLPTRDAIALIEKVTGSEPLPYSAAEMWEILQAWLEYFFPDKYRSETADTVFKKSRRLT